VLPPRAHVRGRCPQLRIGFHWPENEAAAAAPSDGTIQNARTLSTLVEHASCRQQHAWIGEPSLAGCGGGHPAPSPATVAAGSLASCSAGA